MRLRGHGYFNHCPLSKFPLSRKVKGVSVRAKKGRKIKVSWDVDYENTFGYYIQYAQNKRFIKKKKLLKVGLMEVK